MTTITTILVSTISIGIIFFFLYLLLSPTKKQWPTEEKRICPRCKQSDYRMIAASNSGVGLILGISNPHYLCNHCKYKGVFPIIVEDDHEEEQEEKL
jgi:hypothetical protein